MKLPVGVGDRISGKYRVERVLGVGGMGCVVAATHLHLREQRAIKVMLPQASVDATLLARFLREAQSVARLSGEHVARVHDVGQLDSGIPYMVMEYVDGADLASMLRASGALPVEEAILYTLHACEALAEAHALGIVHRDLKPANLLVTRGTDGTPSLKVLDFGVAKTNEDMTQTGAMLGTPRYMAPEQVRGLDVDPRADVWSLGVVLYELLTGTPAFDGKNQLDLLARVTDVEVEPPSARRAGIPAALDEVILRCLEKQPQRRYASVAELAAALEPFAAPDARVLPERVARVLRTKLLAAESSPPAPVEHEGNVDPQHAESPAARPPDAATATAMTEVRAPTEADRRPAPRRIGVAVALALGITVAGSGVALSRVVAPPSAAVASAPVAAPPAPEATASADPAATEDLPKSPPPASREPATTGAPSAPLPKRAPRPSSASARPPKNPASPAPSRNSF
jgi:serine/threonine-protein kinase